VRIVVWRDDYVCHTFSNVPSRSSWS
jgi:hypothetical protein